jgi:mRNA interferase HigB
LSPKDDNVIMIISGKSIIKDFIKKHRDAKNPLIRWLKIAENSNWKSFSELKKTFSSADLFAQNNIKYVVFNIAGNKYRLIAAINFKGQIVIVKVLMTHAEYSKDKWKDRL